MNILIVDDQPNVLASILSGTNWRSHGFSNVYTAGNARKARRIFEENPVDILVTDIEMPGEDGLSLISWVREQGYPTECVVLTSHADFFYAKTAIGLRIIDYVVQPARHEDILNAVLNAREKIEKDKLRNIRLGVSKMTLRAQNEFLCGFFDSWPDSKSIEENPGMFHEKIAWLGDYMNGNPSDMEVLVYRFKILKWNTIPLSPEKILETYLSVQDQTFPGAAQKIISWKPDDIFVLSIQFLSYHEETGARLTEFQEECCRGLKCRAGIVWLYTKLSSLHAALVTLQNLSGPGKEEAGVLEAELPEYTGYESRNSRMYFLEIRNYIRSHISEPLTRAQIADDLHLTQSYVGSVIRSCAGKSSKEFITEIKMTYARKLVLNTSDSIGEIAAKCGYDSFAYFSKVYKDCYSLTPSEDRRRLGN